MEVVNVAEKRPQKKPTQKKPTQKKPTQKKPTQKKPKVEPNRKILEVDRGATVEFPVRDDHSHSEFQEIAPLQTPEDLTPFVPLWQDRARAAGREFPGVESLFGALTAGVAEDLMVARIQADDLVVPKGSTVVLTNPLNHLRFDSADIKGDLVCHGDLVLEVTNLS
jgi:hypothetical protein